MNLHGVFALKDDQLTQSKNQLIADKVTMLTQDNPSLY